MQALSRGFPSPSASGAPVSSQAPAGPQPNGAKLDGMEPHALGPQSDPHRSHRLEDIMHRLRTLHHDHGPELTPKSVEQIRREISELHQIAKMVLDIKRRLMRRMK